MPRRHLFASFQSFLPVFLAVSTTWYSSSIFRFLILIQQHLTLTSFHIFLHKTPKKKRENSVNQPRDLVSKTSMVAPIRPHSNFRRFFNWRFSIEISARFTQQWDDAVARNFPYHALVENHWKCLRQSVNIGAETRNYGAKFHPRPISGVPSNTVYTAETLEFNDLKEREISTAIFPIHSVFQQRR